MLLTASDFSPIRNGRIFIELINWRSLHDLKGTPAEYKAGLDLAIARGWLHESGTYVKLTQAEPICSCNRTHDQWGGRGVEIYQASDEPLDEQLSRRTAPIRKARRQARWQGLGERRGRALPPSLSYRAGLLA